jgi:DNA repair exonuclease SbcCD ATPase subunit
MKIRSVYIDGLHNTNNKKYEFNEITYLFGPNGAGKSTVLHAIQYALLGYIPGTAKNSREALLRHSPKGSIDIILTIEDDDNNVISIERKADSKGTKLITTPENYDITEVVSNIELPIFNFNEFINQTANKLKDYFIKNILPSQNDELDWRTILSNSIADCNFPNRDEIIDYGLELISSIEGDALEQVIRANNLFKDEQSFNKSELKRLQGSIDSLIYYDDYSGPSDLQAIDSELLSLNAFRDELIKYESALEAQAGTREKISKLQEELSKITIDMNEGNNLKDKIDAHYKDLEIYKAKKLEYTEAKNRLVPIVDGEGVCPYTQQSCSSISEQIPSIKAEIKSYNDKLRDIIIRGNKCVQEIQDLTAQYEAFNKKLSSYNNIKDSISILEDSLSNTAQKPNIDKTASELTIEIDRLRGLRSKLEANIQYNSIIDNITKLKYEAELRGQAISSWVKTTDVNGLQTTLMVKPFEELADNMTDIIRKMYKKDDIVAKFNISGKANSFTFGLIRNGTYIPYDLLSSGEKCLYTLALMICITNTNKSPLRLMICDDMFDHLDSATIENTFTTLKKINDIQFIFAGVKDCKNATDVMINL